MGRDDECAWCPLLAITMQSPDLHACLILVSAIDVDVGDGLLGMIVSSCDPHS